MTMEIIQILLLVLLGAVLAVVMYVLKQVQQARSDVQTQVAQLHQSVSQRFDSNVQTVAGHLGIITGQITNTTNVVAQVEGKLGQVQEASRQIFELARQVAALQDILQSPKMRGGLGEFFLIDLLGQVLPSGSFESQYRFGSGTIVDAALFIGQKILCVDSKFPLENFRRMLQTESDAERKNARKQFLTDVKKHVDDIARKYLVPEEDTFDFALMYIPADGIFYSLLVPRTGTLEINSLDLIEYAHKKRVILVSPMTFYAYLQTILHALNAMRIEDTSREIRKNISDLGRHLNSFYAHYSKLGDHLGMTVNAFNHATQEYSKIDKDITRILPDETRDKLSPRMLEKPDGYKELTGQTLFK